MIYGDMRKSTKSERHELMRQRRDEWARMYLAGKTTLEISDQYDIHPSVVSQQLRKAGVKMRKGGRPKGHVAKKTPFTGWSKEAQAARQERAERWLKLYESGMTAMQIAAVEDANDDVVRDVLTRMGVVLRKGPAPGTNPSDSAERSREWRAEQLRLKREADDRRVERMMEIVTRPKSRFAA